MNTVRGRLSWSPLRLSSSEGPHLGGEARADIFANHSRSCPDTLCRRAHGHQLSQAGFVSRRLFSQLGAHVDPDLMKTGRFL